MYSDSQKYYEPSDSFIRIYYFKKMATKIEEYILITYELFWSQ